MLSRAHSGAAHDMIDDEPVVETSHDADDRSDELARVLGEMRLFRAHVIEGVRAALDTLLTDIAADVLGRELRLAPAHLEAIVHRLIELYMADDPVRVRVHPDDIGGLMCALPLMADERLRSGDAILEVRCGSIEATLGVRLWDVLRARLS